MDRQKSIQEPAPPLWQELEAACAAAIRLSQEVATCLQQGLGAHEFVPLLRRESQLADQLRQGIRQLGQQCQAADGNRREDLARHMQTLIEMEQQNYRLLTRKGVVLSGPHFNRYRSTRP